MQWNMRAFGVGAKECTFLMIPCPDPGALDCESARTRLDTRQLAVLASAGRLCPKAVPFSGFGYIRAEKRDL